MKRLKLFIEKFIYTENPAKSFARLSPMDESENGIEAFTCLVSLLGAKTFDIWNNPLRLASFSLKLSSLGYSLSLVRWLKVELIPIDQRQAQAAIDANRETPASCLPFNVGNVDNQNCNADYDFVGIDKNLIRAFDNPEKLEKQKEKAMEKLFA